MDKASKESSATSNDNIKAVLDTFFEYTPLIKVMILRSRVQIQPHSLLFHNKWVMSKLLTKSYNINEVLEVDKASKESTATSNGDIKAVFDWIFEYTP